MNESENDLKNRIIFLKESNLENLQEEFLKNFNEKKIGTKLIKIPEDVREKNINIKETKILSEVVCKQIPKKKKDIISLDINLFSSSDQSLKINTRTSLFKQNFENLDENELIKSRELNFCTGLPDAFKIIDKNISLNSMNSFQKEVKQTYSKSEINTGKNLSDKINSIKKLRFTNDIGKINSENISEKNDQAKFSFEKNEFNSEYKEIHKKNVDFIATLSKDKLLEYNASIKAHIPQKLIEKMKKGYYQNKIKGMKELYSDNPNLSKGLTESHEGKDKDPEIKQESTFKKSLHVKYNGEILYLFLDEDSLFNSSQSESVVNMGSDLDINNKNFSLKEVKNLLMSSNEQHIILGLKLSFYLIDIKFIKEINELNLIQIFLFFIDHKNFQIRLSTTINSVKLFNILFFDDFSIFYDNIVYYANFPAFIINNIPKIDLCSQEDRNKNLRIFINKNSSLVDVKKELLNALKNEDILNKMFINFKNNFKLLKINNEQLENNKYHYNDPIFVLNLVDCIFYIIYLSENFWKIFMNSELEYLIKNLILNYKKLNFDTKNNFHSKFSKSLINLMLVILCKCETPKFMDYYEMLKISDDLKLDMSLNFLSILKNGKSIVSIDNLYENLKTMEDSNKICFLNIITRELKYYDSNNDNNHNKFFSEINTFQNDLNNQISDEINDISFLSRELSYKIRRFKIDFKNNRDYSKVFSDSREINQFISKFKKCIQYLKDFNLTEEIVDYKFNKRESNSRYSSEIKNKYIDQNFSFRYLSSVFDLSNTSLNILLLSEKYPQSISFKKEEISEIFNSIIENSLLVKFIIIFTSMMNDIKNSNLEEESQIKNSLSQFLYSIENFIKLLMNVIKYGVKYYFYSQTRDSTYKDDFIFIILSFPNFINSGAEYYFFKYVSYLKFIFNYEIYTQKDLSNLISKTNFNQEILFEDFNLYLNSNEDLRRSTIYKKIITIDENLNNITETKFKSKYFPFTNNFILQIILSEKIASDVKINYLILMSCILSGFEKNKEELIEHIFSFDLFEIFLMTLINFKDRVIRGSKYELVLDHYIRNLITNNCLNLDYKKSKSKNFNTKTDSFFQVYYDKLNFSDEEELYYFYKFLFILFLYYSSGNIQHRNDFENLITTQFFKILEYFDFCFISSFFKEDSINIHSLEKLIHNQIINNYSYNCIYLYETILSVFFKYFNSNKDTLINCNKNFLIIFIEKVLEILEIKREKNDDGFSILSISKEQLREVLKNKLVKPQFE
jgi:hypothetical protein